jgi:hypothetical protein
MLNKFFMGEFNMFIGAVAIDARSWSLWERRKGWSVRRIEIIARARVGSLDW